MVASVVEAGAEPVVAAGLVTPSSVAPVERNLLAGLLAPVPAVLKMVPGAHKASAARVVVVR
jgi:hypothetical protein